MNQAVDSIHSMIALPEEQELRRSHLSITFATTALRLSQHDMSQAMQRGAQVMDGACRHTNTALDKVPHVAKSAHTQAVRCTKAGRGGAGVGCEVCADLHWHMSMSSTRARSRPKSHQPCGSAKAK